MAHVRRHAACEEQQDVKDAREAPERTNRLGASKEGAVRTAPDATFAPPRAKHPVNRNPPGKPLTNDAVKTRLTFSSGLGCGGLEDGSLFT